MPFTDDEVTQGKAVADPVIAGPFLDGEWYRFGDFVDLYAGFA